MHIIPSVQRSTPAQPHPLLKRDCLRRRDGIIIMCNSTAFLCMNPTQEQCNVAAISNGIMDVIISVISPSFLLGLLLSLRRKAWNSPLKRLSLLLCVFYGVNFASVELYNDLLPEAWCKVFFFAKGYLSLTMTMYVIVIVALLLIQSGAPVVPQHWKHKLISKLHLLYTFWPDHELIFHLLLHVLSLSLAAVEIFTGNSICKRCEYGVHGQYFINYSLLAFALIVLVINIVLLGYFYIKFCTVPSITRRSKWLLLRLFALFVSLLSLVVSDILTYYIVMYYTGLIVEAIISLTIISLVAMLTLLVLVYLPNIQCCKSCMRSPDQAPLLPNSSADNTNPPSVWDHNVPSYTVYSPPPEMSDYMATSARHEPKYAQEHQRHSPLCGTKYYSVNKQ